MRAHIAICINIVMKNSHTHTQRHSYTQIFIYNIKCLMFYSIKFENVNCLNVFVKLKDQSILQKQIVFEISLVTTKKLSFQISKYNF